MSPMGADYVAVMGCPHVIGHSDVHTVLAVPGLSFVVSYNSALASMKLLFPLNGVEGLSNAKETSPTQ